MSEDIENEIKEKSIELAKQLQKFFSKTLLKDYSKYNEAYIFSIAENSIAMFYIGFLGNTLQNSLNMPLQEKNNIIDDIERVFSLRMNEIKKILNKSIN